MKINRVTPDKHKYLHLLGVISTPPREIFFIGNLPKNRQPTVAIVGTRKPTSYGKEVAYRLSYDLAKKGIVIVSGLALGTDAIAHRAALDAGGTTIAVLANSVERIYPRSHEQLGTEIIASGGAILSEYAPPTPARSYQFLARNRIVSGLSDAVVVVEAATRSGTLSTAGHALEQGKDVFAVPGNITSPLSAGCNALLKQGAAPACRAEDIIEAIAPQLETTQSVLPLGSTPLESKILTLLQEGLRDGEQLQQLAKASASDFSQAVTMLEINGSIRSLGANQWTIS